MNAEQRKIELEKIVKNKTPCTTGITLMYHGKREKFDAYQIPLSFLTYNPYNGRIGSEVKSFERQHRALDVDNPKDIEIIERFLWDSKEKANEKTLQSLHEDHQQRYGIVTADGKIIDGNRRASLLNRIWRDTSFPPNTKQHAQFFEAIILPIDADKKEVLRLETTYQMGEDAKVDYGPIEKYLKVADLANEGFTNNEIANFMGVKLGDIKMYLGVLGLMDDYLETYGYTGIYTMLNGNEDSFQKLNSALKQYSAGGVSKMWDYNIEADVSDLKAIAFDYIRLGFDQQDFRDIIRKPTKNNTYTSFFASKDIWEEFVDNHFELTDQIDEEAVDEIIKNNPNGDLKRILKARDNAWKEKIENNVNDIFNSSRDKLSNKQQASEPIKLLKKALEALSSVDTTHESYKTNSKVRTYLEEIESTVNQYSSILNQ